MEKHEDFITMKNGLMTLVKGGKMMPMDLDMTMEDGTKVTTKGAIMRPDGTAHQMVDGERINMKGEMSNIDDEAEVEETKDVDDMSRLVD